MVHLCVFGWPGEEKVWGIHLKFIDIREDHPCPSSCPSSRPSVRLAVSLPGSMAGSALGEAAAELETRKSICSTLKLKGQDQRGGSRQFTRRLHRIKGEERKKNQTCETEGRNK